MLCLLLLFTGLGWGGVAFADETAETTAASSVLENEGKEDDILQNDAAFDQEDEKAVDTVSAEPEREKETEKEVFAGTAQSETDTEGTEEIAGADRNAVTGTDLADFLYDVICDAPTDENGNYVIDPNTSYNIKFSFRENEALQFDNGEALTYAIPDGLIVPDVPPTSFGINVIDGSGEAIVQGNTFEVSNGQLVIRFNRSDPNIDRLDALANVSFVIDLSVRIDENAGSVIFNSDIEKDFVFETKSDLNITKQVSYDGESDTAGYILTVSSVGDNENVTVQDILSGTALVLNHDVTVESSVSGVLSPDIDYDSLSNGFTFTVDEMENGEVLTIRYSASVDNTKITGKGTAEQTRNTARTKSDQVPDGKEVTKDFAGLVNFHKIDKTPEGELVEIGENLYEQTWKTEINKDHKMNVGGAVVSDWIASRSRPFMMFTGDGITVQVTLENGDTETRQIPWSELRLEYSGGRPSAWYYTGPESDGKASYVITYKTIIDTSKALNQMNLINAAQIFGDYVEAGVPVTGVGESEFDFQKNQLGTTSRESTWELVYHADGRGYDEAHIVDDMPRLQYEGVDYIDYMQEDSMEIEGLLEGESYTITFNSNRRTFVIRFYQDEAHAKGGLKATEDGSPRDIVIRYKTTVNQDWLAIAEEKNYQQYYRHTNNATAYADNNPKQSSSYVVPVRQRITKEAVETSEAEIGGVTYPVYRYALTLNGVIEDGVEITDDFDTEYLKYYAEDGVRILGGNNLNPSNEGGSALAADTGEGISITVDSFPKQGNGNFYNVYKIYYSLIVKDEDALNRLNDAAAETGNYTLTNVASWDDLTSNEVNVIHSYYPYVDKELVTEASADNDYVAEFKLIINQNADDLDPASDTLNIQDELSSNLRYVQDSINVAPAAEGMKIRYDSETNTLIFDDVPDDTRFEVTYRARVLGKGNVTYSNTVKFGNYEKTVEDDVTIESTGSGSGSNPSIVLVKRDSEDMNMTLAGAAFRLFSISDGERTPVTDRDGNQVTFTTGPDGSVMITGDQANLGWTLWEDRAYQLVEVTAPAGYELDETPVEFVLSASPSSQTEYALTGDSLTAWNTRTKTEITVTKEWIGPAAQSVAVLLKKGGETVGTAVLDADNNWQYTFENLDKYNNGEAIEYTVEEEPVENYDTEISGSPEAGFVIRNTNTTKVDIPVEKKWEGKEGGTVTIRLYADETEVRTLTLSEADGWKSSFNDLPVYDAGDGHEIMYTVTEDEAEGYTSKIEGSKDTGFTVTNTEQENPKDPEKPAVPEKPQKPSRPGKPGIRTGRSPGTGDNAAAVMWVVLLVCAGGLLIRTLRRRKRRAENR